MARRRSKKNEKVVCRPCITMKIRGRKRVVCAGAPGPFRKKKAICFVPRKKRR